MALQLAKRNWLAICCFCLLLLVGCGREEIPRDLYQGSVVPATPAPTPTIEQTGADPPSVQPTALASGLGITRVDAEVILVRAGMEMQADDDFRGLKRTKGYRPGTMDRAELIGPDEGLLYIYLVFDTHSIETVGPGLGNQYLEPIAEVFDEWTIWCRSQMTPAYAALSRGENYLFEDQLDGQRISIQALLATPGALVSCSMGNLPQ